MGNGPGAAYVAGFVFGGGADVEHDDGARAQPLREFVTTDLFDAGGSAEVGAGEPVEVGDVRGGDVAHRSPQVGHTFAGEAVEDAGAIAPGGEDAGPCERPEMVRGVRDALADLVREFLDRPLALGEHVDDLGAVSVAERLRHRSQRVEERVLGRPVCHRLLPQPEMYSNLPLNLTR